jgi:hypothetical protein
MPSLGWLVGTSVHVIDDKGKFTDRFGLGVVRGMIGLPQTNMHNQSRHGSEALRLDKAT